MRMTVHLIAADDYGWLTPLFGERIVAFSRRRLAALGISDRQRDRALAAVRKELASSGRLTRGEAVEVAERSGFEVTVETRTHLALLVVVGGDACIGPDSGRENVLVATREWIGEPQRREREESLAELARRYFNAFAPASARDFSYWAGLPLRDCRAGLARVAGELEELAVGGETMFAPAGFNTRAPRSPSVRLLSAFDTYLMGYASRAHAVDRDGERRILPGGGVLRPTICVDGRFVGLWSNKRSGRRLTVALEPFEELDDAVMDAIAAEVGDIGRFEGVEARLAP